MKLIILTVKKIVLILSVGILFAISCYQTSYPRISGHRSANFIAPENTLASADSCIRYGIPVMETDVILSKDSVFYLLHDATLDRTTNGAGPIGEWLSKDLDTLDAGSWFGPEWAGEPLPRFTDLLEKARESGLDITVDYRNGRFEDIVALVREYGMEEHTWYTFSYEGDTRAFREQFPEITNVQAYLNDPNDLERVLRELRPGMVVMQADKITLGVVRRCHDRGVKVLALALGFGDKTALHRRAMWLGVDVIASDKPEQLVQQFQLLQDKKTATAR